MYFNPGTPWTGKTVAVLGSGPTMSRKVADSVKHLPRIVLNTTYQLATDADYVYAADPMWWQRWPDVMQCNGWKVTMQSRSRMYPNVPQGVHVMRWGGTVGFDERPGYLRTGGSSGNSGYQALHLAASMGATRILLFGFDCHGGHWHGEHPKPLQNPMQGTYAHWIKNFTGIAPLLVERGIEVVNCTPRSKLECFRQEIDITELAA